MRFQLGIQLILITVAVVIVVTVIKPKFAEIQFNQNEISEYLTALDKAGLYNQTLSELIEKSSRIDGSSRQALERYLPSSVDGTAIARDIRSIVDKNGLLLLEVAVKAEDAVTVSNVTRPRGASTFVEDASLLGEAAQDLTSKTFSVEAIGSYEQMKDMLRDFERNHYPLQVVTFSFEAPSDALLYHYSLELQTYALGDHK